MRSQLKLEGKSLNSIIYPHLHRRFSQDVPFYFCISFVPLNICCLLEPKVKVRHLISLLCFLCLHPSQQSIRVSRLKKNEPAGVSQRNRFLEIHVCKYERHEQQTTITLPTPHLLQFAPTADHLMIVQYLPSDCFAGYAKVHVFIKCKIAHSNIPHNCLGST